MAPCGLQLDLLTVILRLEQIDDEAPELGALPGLAQLLLHRAITCDVPRLRAYLTGETLAWEAQLKDEIGSGTGT